MFRSRLVLIVTAFAFIAAGAGLQGCAKKKGPAEKAKVEKKRMVLPPGLAVYTTGGGIWKLAKAGTPELVVSGRMWFPAVNASETLLAYWEDLGGRMAMNVRNLATGATTKVGEWQTLGALGRNLNLRNAPAWLQPPENSGTTFKDVLFFADGRQIWQVEADGTNLTTIYEHEGAACYGVSPSPDGTRIAFIGVTEKDQNLWTYSTQTHKSQPVTEYTFRDGAAGSPAWSPNGVFIVFVLYKSEDSNLWRIPAEGGTSMQITKEGRTNSAVWDPTGAKLAVSSGNQNPLVWQIHLVSAEDGRFLEQLTVAPAGAFSPSIAGAW